jgi:hypothetical protein
MLVGPGRPEPNARSPDECEVGLFSNVKWVYFRLSKFSQARASGSLFGRQMGLFSLDKNIL